MSLKTQSKVLRVLEEGEVQKVGSNRINRVDVRVIAATNKDLPKEIREGKFREDLYFRLNVVRLNLPPLRERRDDIPLMIEAFLKEFNEQHHQSVTAVTPETRRILYRYPWPGNVRELRNCIEAMVVTARGPTLDVADIPPYISAAPAPANDGMEIVPGISMEDAERIHILRTLEMTAGNREEAARILKIGERTLYRKLDKYGLK
jgi:two-component system response regulator HydG